MRAASPLLLAFLAGAALAAARESARADDPKAAAPMSEAQPQPDDPGPPPEATPEVGPTSRCWGGLGTLASTSNLADLRAAVRQAAAADDDLLLKYLKERLTELIGADPARALLVLEWAELAEEPELSLYLQAVSDADAVRERPVVDKLLGMAEQPSTADHEVATLDALATQRSLEADSLDRLARIAGRDTGGPGAFTAARTIGNVMETVTKAGGDYGPYMDRLLDVAGTSRDESVRMLAVEMSTYSDPPLAASHVSRLVELLLHDPLPAVRHMAALVLSTADDTAAALAAYRQAFPREQDPCIRWAILVYSVRAAGPAALPLIGEFAAVDPRFAADVADFGRIYGSGVRDFERVWFALGERHVECSMQPDEGPGP